jgi:type II secretory pathway pseudopilin PulG
MVVIVLIGIMAAVIIPEMTGTYQDALLRSTSRELINIFSAAYSHAVSVNQVLRVRLDQKTGRYQIEKRVRQGGREDNFVPAPDVPGGEGELDTRISIEIRKTGEAPAEGSGEAAPKTTEGSPPAREHVEGITFYPDGTADRGEIILRDRDGFRLGLRINPVTAQVHVVELARE